MNINISDDGIEGIIRDIYLVSQIEDDANRRRCWCWCCPQRPYSTSSATPPSPYTCRNI